MKLQINMLSFEANLIEVPLRLLPQELLFFSSHTYKKMQNAKFAQTFFKQAKTYILWSNSVRGLKSI